MSDEIEAVCEQMRLLICDLEQVLEPAEWVATGFVLADAIAMMRVAAAEVVFWTEPDEDDLF